MATLGTQFAAATSFSPLASGTERIFGFGHYNSEYEVWIADTYGRPKINISRNQFFSLQYTRVVNAIGTLSLVLPRDFDRTFLKPEYMILVFRRVSQRSLKLDTDTVWFIDHVQRSWSDGGDRTLTVQASCANRLLHFRIVAYPQDDVLGYSYKFDQGDDMMKAIVRENMGSLATDVNRRISSSYLSVAADKAAASTQYRQFARRYLDEIFREICEASWNAGTALYWDMVVVQTDPNIKIEFRTFTGQRGSDRRASTNSGLLVSPAKKTISSFTVTENYENEVNLVYVGGEGEEDVRPVVSDEDTSRSGRGPFSRKEAFYDSRDGNTNTLPYEAQGYLRAGEPQIVYEGKLANVPGAIYGDDWFFGDRMTALDDENVDYDCRVNTVSVSVDNNGEEKIESTLRSDS